MADRDDAALVYRFLRGAGPEGRSVVEIAAEVFPWTLDAPATTVLAVQKRSVGRVLSAVVWMRAQGVALRVDPGVVLVGDEDRARDLSKVTLIASQGVVDEPTEGAGA